MADPGFWAVAMALAAVVAVILITALRRGREVEATAAADLAIYTDQLAEIGRDLARGTISAEEAARLHAEVGRRVLEADRALSQGGEAARTGKGSGLLAAVLLLVLLAGSAVGYWRIGTPGYPDMPLAARLAKLDADMAARPSQVQELARIGLARDDGADETLRALLAQETDPDRLRQSFAARFTAGEIRGAILTQERLAEVAGEGMTAGDHANHALALVAEVQGYVSPEAEAHLIDVLRRDPKHGMARYLTGLMFAQNGRPDRAFDLWKALVDEGPDEAPWVVAARADLETAAALAGIPFDMPDQSGLSDADMAAAAEMSSEDRAAMIEGMVGQLETRLLADGGPAEDWLRLINALQVLNQTDRGTAALRAAEVDLAADPGALQAVREAAAAAGFGP